MTRSSMGQVGAIVAVAVVGALIGRASASVADPEHRKATSAESSPTSRSAAVAAIGFLDALRWNVVINETERRRVLSIHATPRAADELDSQLVAAAAGLSEAVAEPPVVARTAVLGYRVLHADGQRASVRVWGFALFGTGSYEPATQWSTSEVELVWSDDRWLVDGIESRGGPSPSSGVHALARRARGLREVRDVP